MDIAENGALDILIKDLEGELLALRQVFGGVTKDVQIVLVTCDRAMANINEDAWKNASFTRLAQFFGFTRENLYKGVTMPEVVKK